MEVITDCSSFRKIRINVTFWLIVFPSVPLTRVQADQLLVKPNTMKINQQLNFDYIKYSMYSFEFEVVILQIILKIMTVNRCTMIHCTIMALVAIDSIIDFIYSTHTENKNIVPPQKFKQPQTNNCEQHT